MPEDVRGLETAHRTAAVLCGAMAASTLVYALVVTVISVSMAPFGGFAGEVQPSGVRLGLWALAAFDACLIAVVRRTLLAKSPAAGTGPPGPKLIKASIVTAALGEIPAILGLVLFMLSGLLWDFFGLLALSLALQAVYFPRLDGWREWAATGARP